MFTLNKKGLCSKHLPLVVVVFLAVFQVACGSSSSSSSSGSSDSLERIEQWGTGETDQAPTLAIYEEAGVSEVYSHTLARLNEIVRAAEPNADLDEVQALAWASHWEHGRLGYVLADDLEVEYDSTNKSLRYTLTPDGTQRTLIQFLNDAKTGIKAIVVDFDDDLLIDQLIAQTLDDTNQYINRQFYYAENAIVVVDNYEGFLGSEPEKEIEYSRENGRVTQKIFKIKGSIYRIENHSYEAEGIYVPATVSIDLVETPNLEADRDDVLADFVEELVYSYEYDDEYSTPVKFTATDAKQRDINGLTVDSIDYEVKTYQLDENKGVVAQFLEQTVVESQVQPIIQQLTVYELDADNGVVEQKNYFSDSSDLAGLKAIFDENRANGVDYDVRTAVSTPDEVLSFTLDSDNGIVGRVNAAGEIIEQTLDSDNGVVALENLDKGTIINYQLLFFGSPRNSLAETFDSTTGDLLSTTRNQYANYNYPIHRRRDEASKPFDRYFELDDLANAQFIIEVAYDEAADFESSTYEGAEVIETQDKIYVGTRSPCKLTVDYSLVGGEVTPDDFNEWRRNGEEQGSICSIPAGSDNVIDEGDVLEKYPRTEEFIDSL